MGIVNIFKWSKILLQCESKTIVSNAELTLPLKNIKPVKLVNANQ